MPDVDSKLLSSLRQAKTTPMFFAFVAKGTTDGALVVAKKKVSIKEINEAKASSGGKLVFQGRCQGDGAKMIFEVPKEPPGTLAKQIKKVISDDAGMTLQVEVRVRADLEEEGDEAAEGTDDANRFTERVKVLAPDLQKLVKLGTPVAQQAQQKVKEANAAFGSKDYPQANALLDQAEPLIKQALTAPPQAAPAPPKPPPAPPKAPPAAPKLAPAAAAKPKAPPTEVKASSPPPKAAPPRPVPPWPPLPPIKPYDPAEAALQAEWERRVIAVEPRVLEAKKIRAGEAKWMTLFMAVQDLGEAGEYARALKILDNLEKLLNAPPAPKQEPASNFVAMQKARLEAVKQTRALWDTIGKHLQETEQKILGYCQSVNNNPQAGVAFDMAKVKEKVQKLYTIGTDLDGRLFDELDEALSAADPQKRDQLHQKAKGTITEYLTMIKTSPLLTAMSQSAVTASPLQQALLDALSALQSKL